MRAYLDVGACVIEESQTEDVDWVNNWKQYFHQFYIDDILVIPSWEKVEEKDSDKLVIHIDPGTAFGTGMHETTQLCIRQLKKYVKDDTMILDVGCGSGILGMLALKFGARYSVGTDLDPCAIDATHENMEVNGIRKDQYEVMIGNIIDDKAVQDKAGYGKYDIVAANILADVLTFVWMDPYVIFKNSFPGNSLSKFYLKLALYTVITIFCSVVTKCMILILSLSGLFAICIYGCMAVMITAVVFILTTLKLQEYKYLKQIFVGMIKKKAGIRG